MLLWDGHASGSCWLQQINKWIKLVIAWFVAMYTKEHVAGGWDLLWSAGKFVLLGVQGPDTGSLQWGLENVELDSVFAILLEPAVLLAHIVMVIRCVAAWQRFLCMSWTMVMPWVHRLGYLLGRVGLRLGGQVSATDTYTLAHASHSMLSFACSDSLCFFSLSWCPLIWMNQRLMGCRHCMVWAILL